MTLIQDVNEVATQATLAGYLQRYREAQKQRQNWEPLWRQAYQYALPQRNGFADLPAGARQMDQLYDATALDSVEQLAASILGNLTPPWTQWFGFKPGPDLNAAQAEALSPALEKAAKIIRAHFDRSNFMVEMHQCFLDLVVGGTAALVVEENEPGAYSALKFTAVPLHMLTLEEGEDGLLTNSYRNLSLNLAQLKARYPLAILPVQVEEKGHKNAHLYFDVLEIIAKNENGAFEFKAILQSESTPHLLRESIYAQSPLIAFRWLKSPGEIYGRSPVMKALPDIRTANKVVELILKNASIAVTGIWQADDDGVLNPANIELRPGAIIPKAVGSRGLTPLEMPGRFDISQIILEDLRAHIRHALMTDKLAPLQSARMTATEILERSSEMALLLGATYGRLQAELLTPLVHRAFSILRRRGEVADIHLDGRFVELDYRAPLARSQGQRNVQNTLSWIQTVIAMGPEAQTTINFPEAARFLGEALGVSSELIRKADLEGVNAIENNLTTAQAE
jgi:hypothetical protein